MSFAAQQIREYEAMMIFMYHEIDIDERHKCLMGDGKIIDGKWVNDEDEDESETDDYIAYVNQQDEDDTDEDDYVEYDENKNNEIVEDTDDVDKKEDEEEEICPSCGDEVTYTLT